MPMTYDEMATAAERGELARKPGTRLSGEQAAEAGRAALLEATGARTIQEAAHLAVGRPRVGSELTGPSRQFRVRASDAMYAAVQDVAAREGRGVSEVVREAIAEYLTHQDEALASRQVQR